MWKVDTITKFSDSMIFKLKKNYNKLMIFKWVLFDDFHSMLLQDLKLPGLIKNYHLIKGPRVL